MAVTFNKHPYEITLLYPHTATSKDDASAYVTLRAPERGDRRVKGRNQSFSRLKNGNVVVYDMGTSMSDMLNLTFESVPQSEFAALIVFFEHVVWGANKIKYIDYKGDSYIVRVFKNTVDSVNKGETKFGANESTLYDFTLDLIDVTNNVSDTGQTAMPTQLAIHVADTNHPHNPRVDAQVTSADGTKLIEAVAVDSVKHVTWIVVAYYGTTYAKTVLVHAVHNGTASADATSVNATQETLTTVGSDPGDITLSVALSGSGVNQMLRLQAAKAAGTVDLSVRRIKV